ncbi:pirin family protein [Maricaulis sp.]|uniref:pirin family protein n=1 Tax=Maricaulis sp. TaxID=1486257 RepID=UPI0026360848|nr:pirin family protein [Maricaulis sp.]
MSASIELVISGRARDLGGFEVRRVLPAPKRRLVGPFIFFDQMGPAQFEPGTGIDVRPHPHIGLATVTYLFDGALRHRDTIGVDTVIRPGEVNWMTAGYGVAHSERTPSPEREDGHYMFGIQTWVALPEEHEEDAPLFEHAGADELPDFERGDGRFRLILGTAWGHTAPIRQYSPIFYLHGELPAGARLPLDIEHDERAVYLVQGAMTIDGVVLKPGDMAVIAPGSAPEMEASADSRIMICGGAPLGERHIFWNFVATRKDKIEAAKAAWQAAGEDGFPAGGRFLMPEGETEFIPLPAE